MVKVSWADKNIFTSYDMPGYIYLDTEGATVQLYVYTVYEGTLAVLIDDRRTGTNRTGQQIIRIWDVLPFPYPSSVPAIYTVFVEVYDTSGNLIKSEALKCKVVRSNTVLRFIDSRGYPLIGIINYVDSDGFFIHYYGESISIPFDPNGYIEFVRQSGKYYLISKLGRLIRTPGSYNVTVNPVPEGKVHLYMDIKIDSNLLQQIFNLPIISPFSGFITWLLNNISTYSLYIATRILEWLGLINFVIDKVEVVSTNPFIIRIYITQDLSPVLVGIIIVGAVVVSAIAIWIGGKYIVDIVQSHERIATVTRVSEIYSNYTNLVNQAMNWCSTQYSNNPDMARKCMDEVLSRITVPTTSAMQTIKEIEELQSKLKALEEGYNTMKMVAIIAGAIAVALILTSRGGR